MILVDCNRKKNNGVVVSDRMKDVRVVAVDRRVQDTRYGKVRTFTKRYKVRDALFNSKIGDRVSICEARPFSKSVSWCLTKIVKRSVVVQ